MRIYILKILYVFIKYYDYGSYKNIKYIAAYTLLLFFLSINILSIIYALNIDLKSKFNFVDNQRLNNTIIFIIFSIPYVIFVNLYFKEKDILKLQVTDKQFKLWKRNLLIYVIFSFIFLVLS